MQTDVSLTNFTGAGESREVSLNLTGRCCKHFPVRLENNLRFEAL